MNTIGEDTADTREYHVVVERRQRTDTDGNVLYDKSGKAIVDVIRNLIGVRVRQRRLEHRWSHKDLSSEIALVSDNVWNPKSQETLRIEQQRKFVTDYEVKLIAMALRCSVAWLMEETNEKPAVNMHEDNQPVSVSSNASDDPGEH